MKIYVLPVGDLRTNCYILAEEEHKLCAIIDPGDEAERILAQVQAEGLQVKYILLTHGHFDHISAVPELHEAFPDAKVYIHPADAQGAVKRKFPLSTQVDELLLYDEGDRLELGGLTIEVMNTPGHSLGSVVLRVGDVLFSGDTLFAGTCGRTDLRGGSPDQMWDSLRRLGQLEGDFRVLPGHGSDSTLEQERKTNHYMLLAMNRA